MGKVIGYTVTWTTYGTWLQGDKRGYVKGGKTLTGDEKIKEICQKLQKQPTVILNKVEKETVQQAILTEAEKGGQTIKALVVCTNHVHLIAKPCCESIEKIVSRYKNVAMFALYNLGRKGRIWSHGFDKRFCFTEDELTRRIEYVRRHSQKSG
jgi:REP element-mobilizing transposase RayT